MEKENGISVSENKPSFFKGVCANFLDQLLIVAISALLVVIFDFILQRFGYRITEGDGAIILITAIVYFIIYCIYEPVMKKTSLKNTIARKIVSNF